MFVEGEAPAFTINQMILDLMDLCYYDGQRQADEWAPATKKMLEEISNYVDLLGEANGR